MIGRGASSWRYRASIAAALVFAICGTATASWLVVGHPASVIAGRPRPTEQVGVSDEDQIRDVLQAISDAYNHGDVKNAETHLCARAQSMWDARLETVWLNYRQQHGSLKFRITSITVDGVVAHVSGTQTYTHDARPRDFTAEMGRGPRGWKMCSST